MRELQRFSADASTKEVLAAIQEDGAAIWEGLMSKELADQIHEELIEYIEATRDGMGFTGEHTTRTGALAARSKGCCDLIVEPNVLAAVDQFLEPYCDRIQLHLTQVIRIKPGQKKQPLHRDRQAWGEIMPPSIEPQLNTLWALTDFTHENGGTQVIPGSQTWDYSKHPNPDEAISVEMSRGSLLLYSGSVIHGGGANDSTMDRMGINITYSLGWLRQEENQYLSCPPEIAKDMDPRLQELLGYTMGSVACGYYSDPDLPAGEAREVAPPERVLGRAPRDDAKMSIALPD